MKGHTNPGGSWATPVYVYIPNILQKHPVEFEQASECVPQKEKKVLNISCSLEFVKVFFSSFVRDLCLKKPSGKYSP
jgi:hypothetical protein